MRAYCSTCADDSDTYIDEALSTRNCSACDEPLYDVAKSSSQPAAVEPFWPCGCPLESPECETPAEHVTVQRVRDALGALHGPRVPLSVPLSVDDVLDIARLLPDDYPPDSYVAILAAEVVRLRAALGATERVLASAENERASLRGELVEVRGDLKRCSQAWHEAQAGGA